MILPGTTILTVWLAELPSVAWSGIGAAAAPRVEWDPTLLINSLYLVAILLAGALLIALVNRWRQKGENRLGPSDQLAQYRTLYEEGAISQEEFDRLRALLGGQLRRQAKESVEKQAPASATSVTGDSGPPDAKNPQNPSRSSEPPETGIRPA